MTTISVLLPTFNEADKILECLESVKWADEILVVDSYSTDATIDIVSQYGARVIQHEYVNSAKQKNWAIPQCKHEWVLQIDADERLDPDLQAEIQQLLISPLDGVDGYEIRRKNHILGTWIKTMSAYPGWRLSLFRRDVVRYQDLEVNARAVVPSEVRQLKGHVSHYGFEAISPRLRSIDRYTRYEADERKKQGRRFSVVNMLVRSLGVFLYTYFWQLGFTSGVRGLILSVYKADFVFWTYAKMWEKNLKSRCL